MLSLQGLNLETLYSQELTLELSLWALLWKGIYFQDHHHHLSHQHHHEQKYLILHLDYQDLHHPLVSLVTLL